MSFNVILVCDHKWRDLPGLVWLKRVLRRARSSWHCTIISKFRMFDHARVRPPSLVIMPSSNDPWLKYAEDFRRGGASTVILPTEGRPTYGRMMHWSVSSHDDRQADGILLWSETMERAWKTAPNPNARQAAVVGPGRFDFYRPPLCSLLPKAADFARRIGAPECRPIVSWATTFPHAKFFGKEDWQIADWTRMGIGKLGLSESLLREFIQMEHEGRRRSWASLRACAHALPETTFCLKPHPLEDFRWCERQIAEWRSDGLNNVWLVKGFYIWDLLNAAAVHVHRSCTTGTEAWLLGKPTVEPEYIVTPAAFLEDGEALAGAARDAEAAEEMATTPEDLAERIRSYVEGRPVPENLVRLREQYARRWFHDVDGCATQRAVEQICQWVEEWKPKPKSFWHGNHLKTRIKWKVKEAIGFPVDEWIREPGRPIESELDFAGHWDREICQRDVLDWERKLNEC